MVELPDLYPHQAEQKDRVRDALAKHHSVILAANPGVGKTRMSKWILGAALNRKPGENASGRYLWTVHRRSLVDNAVQSFLEEPALRHGIVMSGEDTAYGERIQVASIDTLLSWFIENNEYPSDITFDLVVADEAHAHHAKYARFLQLHDAKREELNLHPAYVIGLTATPQATGLADVYKEIVLGPSTQWLIENKYLAPYRYFRATQGKLDLLKKRGGDYTQKSVSEAMDGMSGDLVRDWKQYAEGRPTVGFFPRRKHAKAAMAELIEAGVNAEYVDGETDDDERRRIFRRLNNAEIDYLCNVQVVERGTDIPRIGCIQLCVATSSIVRYRQLIGRGSRIHPEKTDCIVIDHGGCIKKCGFFEDDPNWSLDITTKDPGEAGARPTIECPKCNALYRGGKCKNCGYEPSKQERKGQGLEFDGSELKEVKPKEKTKAVRSAEDLMVSALYIAGKSGRTWRQACGMFKGMCEKQGTPHRVPSSVSVGGNRYRCIRYGSNDSNRRVSVLYPFTVNPGDHSGNYLEETESVGSAF